MLQIREYSLMNVPKRIFNLVISQKKLAERKKKKGNFKCLRQNY